MTDHPAADSERPAIDRKQFIKLAVELGPLVVFFLVNWQSGRFLADPKQAIFVATGAFMAATVVSLVTSKIMLGRIAAMPLVTGAFVVVFGGLTLWLQDDHFIKVKPTIVNALFAGMLFTGLVLKRPLLKLVFGDAFQLTEEGWQKLTVRWALFFVALAILNEVVWRNFPTDTWVSFKVFGIMPLTMIFAVAQIGLLRRYEAPLSEAAVD